MADAIMTTDLQGVKLLNRGKVRDLYDVGDSLLIVATDRISVFDVVLPTPIPDKGRVLTALTLFWIDKTKDIVENHLITADVSEYPEVLQPYADILAGRSMLVKKAEVLPVECVVRGYLAGSGWKEYKKEGTVCKMKLPEGLRQADKLPEPIFTPSTKATSGHDINISPQEAAEMLGQEVYDQVEKIAISLYTWASEYAAQRGIILADTKFEFGNYDGRLIVIDEMFTPDSSRFWEVAAYEPGKSQASFDKQYVRDWAESTGWNKEPPAPEVPAEVVAGTRKRYLEAYKLISGEDLPVD